MAHVIVLGNEKGGSGKSTTAVHLATALMRSGRTVGVIDLDLRQRSVDRFFDNRTDFISRKGINLPVPARATLTLSDADSQADAQAEETARFDAAVAGLSAVCDFVLIDCPGAFTRYAHRAHSAADTLITPMNDSLVDFDLLARLNPADGRVMGPSVYAEMVWKARQDRALAGRRAIDWVVLRNRLSSLDARNKRRVAAALADLSRRIGFRLAPGFTERVIFRELFLSGLTLLDLRDSGEHRTTMSGIAARQEVRDLLSTLRLPSVTVGF